MTTSRRVFYGWWIALTLAVTEPVVWGVLYYAFSVFIEPMQRELGWSRNQLTGSFSLALLIAGVAAVPFGRWLDQRGPRLMMSLGSMSAALLILAWSRVHSYPVFVLIWLGLGLCMAATFYEPAFAAITTWFDRYRSRALTLVTFGGGFASVIFIPLSAWLIERFGWRDALGMLAVVIAATAIPLHALVLKHRPEDIGTCIDGNCGRDQPPHGDAARPVVSLRNALESRSFQWLGVAFGLTMFVNVATTVLLIPLLIDRGETTRFAATAAAAIGLLALPGRLVFTPLGDWLPKHVVPAVIFIAQAVALVVLGVSDSHLGVWAFVVLFGIGFGAITPARASLVADLYGVVAFASISGVLALIVTVARAAGPLGGSLIASISDGDRPLLLVLAGMSVLAALCVHRATSSAGAS